MIYGSLDFQAQNFEFLFPLPEPSFPLNDSSQVLEAE